MSRRRGSWRDAPIVVDLAPRPLIVRIARRVAVLILASTLAGLTVAIVVPLALRSHRPTPAAPPPCEACGYARGAWDLAVSVATRAWRLIEPIVTPERTP